MADDELMESLQLYCLYDDGRQISKIGYIDRNGSKPTTLPGPALPVLGNAVAGAVGAAVSNTLTYPLSLVVSRLQTQNARLNSSLTRKDGREKHVSADEYKYTSILDALRKIYAREGRSGLYSGLAQDTIKTVTDSFLFFLAYTVLRQRSIRARFGEGFRGRRRNIVLPVLDELGIGILAGAFARLFTTPLGNIVTRKQVSSSSSSEQSPSTRQIAAQILREKGLTGFWSGYSATLLMTLNPSITLFLNELLHYLVLRRILKRTKSSALLTFLLAALSKAVASTIMYPFAVAKTRTQASSSNETADSNSKRDEIEDENEIEIDTLTPTLIPPILSTVLTIAKTEGISALYSGLSAEVLKGFFSAGFTILTKDAMYASIVRVYYLFLVLLHRYPAPEALIQQARERADEYEYTEGARRLIEGRNRQHAHFSVSVHPEFSPDHHHIHVMRGGPIGGEDDSNATAEMVGEYVEDDTEGWRSLYHWFWEVIER